VLAAGPQVEEHLRPLLERRIGGMRIRIHGDYHLGQVLHTGKDIVVIDFEGEPARSIGERRLKRPALTDVAGMLRSYDYAAFGALSDERATGAVDGEVATLDRWARAWYDWSARAFLDGYRGATAGAGFLPGDDEGFIALLDALLLSKAAYELRYELNSRPDWIGIPLAGIEALLAG
jgi:maltose alpha-D-glucosyltransferase/alpha-amylase